MSWIPMQSVTLTHMGTGRSATYFGPNLGLRHDGACSASLPVSVQRPTNAACYHT